MGFIFGMFCLAVKFFVVTRQTIMAQNSYQEEQVNKFTTWANKACANGFSSAQLIEVDSYKVVCR